LFYPNLVAVVDSRSPIVLSGAAPYIGCATETGNRLAESAMVKSSELIPYSPHHARTVLGWIDSEETLCALDCPGTFPPHDELVDRWQDDEVRSFLLSTEHGVVAYGELRPSYASLGADIQHVLVSPVHRGQGFGSRIVAALVGRAGELPGIAKLQAILPGDSEPALGCFLRAGFRLIGTRAEQAGLIVELVLPR
jgi:ribosomal protein S18 acetylase RimI-like enzyme